MSEEWIRRLERGAGTPSFDAIEALANALSVSPSEFFELSQPKALRLSALDAKLLHLSDSELNWIFDLIKVAVAHKDYK